VLTTGFGRADAIASPLVVVVMLKAGYGLVRDSGRIFLEAAPAGLDPDALGDRLAAQDAVVEVHDLHLWQIASGQNALSAHVLVQPGGHCHAVRRCLQSLLLADYSIGHATLQVDHVGEDTTDLLADQAGRRSSRPALRQRPRPRPPARPPRPLTTASGPCGSAVRTQITIGCAGFPPLPGNWSPTRLRERRRRSSRPAVQSFSTTSSTAEYNSSYVVAP
jgi:hypothetical protein